MTEKKKIGDMLIEQGAIDKYQLKAALNRQERWGKKLGETLVEMGFITEDILIKTLSTIFNIPSIKPEKFDIAKNVLKLVPKEVCARLCAIPLAIKTINGKKRLVVAMSDPTNFSAIDEIQFLTNIRVLPMVTSYGSIQTSMHKYYGSMPTHNEVSGEISVISKVSKPGEYMEIIRDGKEEKIKVNDKNDRNNVFADIENRVESARPKASSEFGKALEDKLKNFEIEETKDQPEPQPLADYEYEESTGVFKEDNIFNKLVKILKHKQLLSEQELKVLLGVSSKDGSKQLKDAKSMKVLLELLLDKNLISEKDKKLIEED